MNWEISLRAGEENEIKLDLEWIKRLRNAWVHPVSEQVVLQGQPSVPTERSRRSIVAPKHTHRRFTRLSIPLIKSPVINEIENSTEEQSKTDDNYSHQKFLDWRLFSNNNNLSQFQLYILPVRV